MKKLTKDSFKFLSDVCSIMSLEEMGIILGGDGISTDCVLNCLGYLDPSHSAGWYGNTLQNNMGYSTSTVGGVYRSQICSLGAFGGLSIQEANGPVGITANGQTSSGASIMMTFNSDNNLGHAVVVTGTRSENGKTFVTFADPTTGSSGERESGSYSGLYIITIPKTNTTTTGNNTSSNGTNTSSH